MEKIIRLALVGVGKIARDQHLPALRADPRYALVAAVDPRGGVEGLPAYPDLAALLAADHELDAVSIATPAAGRHALAAQAIAAGLHVMVEKPPTATLAEVDDLARRAADRGTTFYTSWHSRAAAGVAGAREWLAGRTVTGLRIEWREDVRRWHPGQEWIFGPGGFGVFDPGINALSIATAILPAPLFVTAATLRTPGNRDAPIAASLELRVGDSVAGSADFDFRQTGPQSWDIMVDTDAGTLKLHDGGSRLVLPGAAERTGEDREYSDLYAHFAQLIADRRSDVDATPLRLVADAMLIAAHERVEDFDF